MIIFVRENKYSRYKIDVMYGTAIDIFDITGYSGTAIASLSVKQIFFFFQNRAVKILHSRN